MPTRDSAFTAGTPCWIDLMTTYVESARNFYGDLFGWEFEIGGPETAHYSTGHIDGKRVAGIFETQVDHPPVWTTYLATDDADATAARVAELGGTVASPTMDVMDLGRMTVVLDPTGGTFGTYAAAGFVRRNLTAAGFTVERQPGFAGKREMLRGRKD